MSIRLRAENAGGGTVTNDQVHLCSDFIERNGGAPASSIVLTDYAISGTVLARAGFDRLLALVGSREVDLVITESGDRLTRDLGDADRLWKLCEFNNVRLICVSDGIDSARDGSRMAFRFKAIMSDEYVRDLAKKTYRGLSGQFSRDFSTGGLAYGYRSMPVMNGGRDPDGYTIEIDAEKATTVRQIFSWYAEGHSFIAIADKLNKAGLLPPRAGTKTSAKRYWRKSTLSMIVANRTYLGEFSFGVKSWRKDPTTRKRRYVKRAAHEVLHDLRPQLTIIPQELFEACIARRKQVTEYTAPRQRTTQPFSGLIFCGLCGSRMGDAGGSKHRYYKCSGAREGGICDNHAPLRSDMLLEAATAALQRVLSSPEVWQELEREIQEQLGAFQMTTREEETRLHQELGKVESEINRLVNFIATTDAASGSYDAVRASLEAATTKKKAIQAKLAALATACPEAPRTPSPDEIAQLAAEVAGRFGDDPVTTREFLRATVLKGSRLELFPRTDGGWDVRSEILPLRIPPALTRKAPGVSSGAFKPVVQDGCGGLQRPVPYAAVGAGDPAGLRATPDAQVPEVTSDSGTDGPVANAPRPIYSHGPPAGHRATSPAGEEAAASGLFANTTMASTASPRSPASRRPALRAKAVHWVFLVASCANERVSATGSPFGNGVPRRSNVAAMARASSSPSKSNMRARTTRS